MKISIIVPIYNSEKYLRRCILSVIKQTYSNFEFILVNDGSTDKSGFICQQAKKKDNRIIVIDKKNEGQGIARNVGIKQATGDYIMFLDSDDILIETALEELIKPLKKKLYDVVCGQYYEIKHGKKKKISYSFGEGVVEKGNEIYKKLKSESLFGYVWGKLYRREFLEKNQIYFEDIRTIFMEDTLYNLQVMEFHPSYYFIQKEVCYYYIHKNTSSNQEISNLDERVLRMISSYEKSLDRNRCWEQEQDLMLPLFSRLFCWTMIQKSLYTKLDFQNLKQIVDTFLDNRTVHRILEGKRIVPVQKKLEKLFYTYCLFCLRHSYRNVLASTFFICSPIMKLYIKRNLSK